MTLSGLYYRIKKIFMRRLHRTRYSDLLMAKRKLKNIRLIRAYSTALKDIKNVKIDSSLSDVKRRAMSKNSLTKQEQ